MTTPAASGNEETSDGDDAVRGRRIALVGRFGGMPQRELRRLLRDRGAVVVDRVVPDIDVVVIGADELPLGEEALLDQRVRVAAAEGRLEIINETQLWERLGWFEDERSERLYTPAMLAGLLDVPLAIVRRWHRRGLIVPVREVRRLPYFDFREVATARQLARLLATGMSPGVIERKLAELARFVPDVERPLAQLSVMIQGKQILLRQGGGLVEPGGQLRIDFDALDASSEPAEAEQEDTARAVTLPFSVPADADGASVSQLLETAAVLEEEGRLEEAIECYRAALAAGGARAEICFQLAELLYRSGDASAARERYYMAIELDEDFVEARANLGCVLAEMGQRELAIAAFEGALRFHPEYPDVHYHLARVLDEVQRFDDAERHWREFVRLAPDSPWSDQARRRLGLSGK